MKAGSARGLARAAAAAAGLAAGGGAAAAPAGLDFDRTFSAEGAPAQAHFVATYQAAGGTHRLEVWREGEERLRRRTDDAIETVLQRAPGAAEWSMTVLDLGRRIRTDIDRSNLHRIGHFAGWFGMAHGLARPRGAYVLDALDQSQRPKLATIAPCRWYRLAQGERGEPPSAICWSAALALPLAITGAGGAGDVRWRVEVADTSPLAAGTFAIDDAGFVRTDANADIQAD